MTIEQLPIVGKKYARFGVIYTCARVFWRTGIQIVVMSSGKGADWEVPLHTFADEWRPA